MKINVPAHKVQLGLESPANAGYVVTKADKPGFEARAAAIQIAPGSWDAYVWCTAFPKQVKKTTLHYTLGGDWKKIEDAEYPFEFSIPVPDEKARFRYRLEGETAKGEQFNTSVAEVGLGR